jgi:hypothetical protein
MRWCDENPNIIKWASEEISILYYNPIKSSTARYYPDLLLIMPDGKKRLIEIKPKVQTQAPEKPKRSSQRYLTEVATWAVNNEKWKSAKEFCANNNVQFEIWTEDTLKQMGISTTATGTQKVQKAASTKPKLKPLIQKHITRVKRRS